MLEGINCIATLLIQFDVEINHFFLNLLVNTSWKQSRKPSNLELKCKYCEGPSFGNVTIQTTRATASARISNCR